MPNGTVLAEGDFSDGEITLNDIIKDDFSNVGNGIEIEFSEYSKPVQGISNDTYSVVICANPTFVGGYGSIPKTLKVRIPKEKLVLGSNIFEYDSKASNAFILKKTYGKPTYNIGDGGTDKSFTIDDKIAKFKELEPFIKVATSSKLSEIKYFSYRDIPDVNSPNNGTFWSSNWKDAGSLFEEGVKVSQQLGTIAFSKNKTFNYKAQYLKLFADFHDNERFFAFRYSTNGTDWNPDYIVPNLKTYLTYGPNIKKITTYID